MTMTEFKHSDLYSCLKVAGELAVASSKFIYSIGRTLLKFTFWIGKKTYNYISK